jgi:hypothetical protein
MKILNEYVFSLFDKEFISTGLRTALFVGSLLFLINHGFAFWRGEMNYERWISVRHDLRHALPSNLISHLLQFGKLREINNVCTQETLCLAKENCII